MKTASPDRYEQSLLVSFCSVGRLLIFGIGFDSRPLIYDESFGVILISVAIELRLIRCNDFSEKVSSY